MTELACQVDPRFVASRLEAGERKSYSVDTVERVRALGEQPYFIIGADAFAEIASWHRWQDLVRLTEFIVVTRPGHQLRDAAGRASASAGNRGAAGIFFRNKAKLAAGEIPAELPPAVGRYIFRAWLVPTFAGARRRKSLKPLFNHR
jgi:nicotinate-nucleotide adenylyltransferase